MKTQLISINPCFYTELGHNYYYLQSVEKACQIIGWDFFALLPEKNILEGLPSNWLKVLKNSTIKVVFERIEKTPYKRPRRWIRAKQRIKYGASLAKALLKRFKSSKKAHRILFYEAFALTDLELLLNLLRFLPLKNTELWLMLRYPSTFFKSEIERYKSFIEKVKKTHLNLKLVTDTELLKEDLEACFKFPFHVFPLPIPENQLVTDYQKSTTSIQCWWPGIVRQGKGLDIIQKFAQSQNESNRLVQLIASKSAQLSAHSQSPHLLLLEDSLSKEDYDLFLKKSHFILLPYNDPCYEKTSSNIFMETILSGSIPLVYPNTWMSHELQKYSLEKLILDWDANTLSDKMIAIDKDLEIKKKLNIIKQKYLEFHNIESYGKQMLELAKTSSNEN